MEELLANPAVQAGIAPFAAALLLAAILRRTRLQGLAIVGAFAVVVALTIGFSFESLTSVRKLVLAGVLAAVPVLGLELARVPATAPWRFGLALAVAGSAVWVVWRILVQQEDTARTALSGAAAALYAGSLVDAMLRAGSRPVAATSASVMLGLGTGVLALLGASAQLAQMGIAVGAGAGAVLLLQMVAGRPPAGWTIALPAAVVSALAGVLAVFSGSLAWYALLPLLTVPWMHRFVDEQRHPAWLAAILTGCLALVPAVAAVAIAWGAPTSA